MSSLTVLELRKQLDIELLNARISEAKVIKTLVGKSHHMDMKKKDMAYWIDKRIAKLEKQRSELTNE